MSRNIGGVGYLAVQPGSIGAFGGWNHEPAAIRNIGSCVLSNRRYRRLGFRQPCRHWFDLVSRPSAAAHVVDRLAPSLAANVDFDGRAAGQRAASNRRHDRQSDPQCRCGDGGRACGEARHRCNSSPVRSRNRSSRPRPQTIAAADSRARHADSGSGRRIAWRASPERKPVADAAAAAGEAETIVLAALSDPAEVLPPESRPRRRQPQARPIRRLRHRDDARPHRACRRVPGGRALHRPISVGALPADAQGGHHQGARAAEGDDQAEGQDW